MGATSRPFSPLVLLFALFLPILYTLDKNIHRQYVFEPAKLQEISRTAIAQHGNNTEPLMRQIHRDLRTEYGDAIIKDYAKEDWMWNNAGGAMVSFRPDQQIVLFILFSPRCEHLLAK